MKAVAGEGLARDTPYEPLQLFISVRTPLMSWVSIRNRNGGF